MGPETQQYHIPRQEMYSMFQEPEPGARTFHPSSPFGCQRSEPHSQGSLLSLYSPNPLIQAPPGDTPALAREASRDLKPPRGWQPMECGSGEYEITIFGSVKFSRVLLLQTLSHFPEEVPYDVDLVTGVRVEPGAPARPWQR